MQFFGWTEDCSVHPVLATPEWKSLAKFTNIANTYHTHIHCILSRYSHALTHGTFTRAVVRSTLCVLRQFEPEWLHSEYFGFIWYMITATAAIYSQQSFTNHINAMAISGHLVFYILFLAIYISFFAKFQLYVIISIRMQWVCKDNGNKRYKPKNRRHCLYFHSFHPMRIRSFH